MRKILYISILILFLSACSKQDGEFTSEKVETEGIAVELAMNLSEPEGVYDFVSSFIASTVDENKIYNLGIFVFDNRTSTGKTSLCEDVIELDYSSNPLTIADAGQVLKQRLILQADKSAVNGTNFNKKVYVIANYDKSATSTNINKLSSEITKGATTITDMDALTASIDATCQTDRLLIVGTADVTYNKGTNPTTTTLTLTRKVAKFVVKNITNTTTQAKEDGTNMSIAELDALYKVTGIKVSKLPSKVVLFGTETLDYARTDVTIPVTGQEAVFYTYPVIYNSATVQANRPTIAVTGLVNGAASFTQNIIIGVASPFQTSILGNRINNISVKYYYGLQSGEYSLRAMKVASRGYDGTKAEQTISLK